MRKITLLEIWSYCCLIDGQSLRQKHFCLISSLYFLLYVNITEDWSIREDGSAIGFLAKMFFLSFCIFSFLKIAFGEWKIDLSLAISLIELFFLKEGALYSLNETSWNWI